MVLPYLSESGGEKLDRGGNRRWQLGCGAVLGVNAMEQKQQAKPGVGFRVGKLTVAEPTEKRKNGYTVWRCACDCGGSIELDTRCLKRGTVRDCGCETVVKPGQKDVTGQRFGKLTALYPIGETCGNGSLVWHCRCDCGGEVDAPLHQLATGYRKSCGCLSHPQLKDYVGKRFGKLVVLEYAGKRAGMHRWRCVCDCGKETIVGQTLLQSGKTQSCGCRKEEAICEKMAFVDGTSVTLLERASTRLIASNTSGYNGVYQNKKNKKWTAQITFKGKTYYLGAYSHIEDAVKARKKAEERIYGEFLEWYYDTHPQKKKQERT